MACSLHNDALARLGATVAVGAGVQCLAAPIASQHPCCKSNGTPAPQQSQVHPCRTPARRAPPGPSLSSSSSCLGAREGGRRRGVPGRCNPSRGGRGRRTCPCRARRARGRAPAPPRPPAPPSARPPPSTPSPSPPATAPAAPGRTCRPPAAGRSGPAPPGGPPARQPPSARPRTPEAPLASPGGRGTGGGTSGACGSGREREGRTDLLLDAALDLGLFVLALLALLLAAARGRAGVHQRLQVHPLAQGPLVEPGCHCSRPRRAAAPRSSSDTRRSYSGGGLDEALPVCSTGGQALLRPCPFKKKPKSSAVQNQVARRAISVRRGRFSPAGSPAPRPRSFVPDGGGRGRGQGWTPR